MSLTLRSGTPGPVRGPALCRTFSSTGSDLNHLLLGTLEVQGSAGSSCPLPPTGGVTLLFPADGDALLCGPLSHAHLLDTDSDKPFYGAMLRWDCGEWLWNEGMAQLTDRAVPLEPLLPGSDRLGSALARCTSPQEQSALMARMLTLRGARQYRSAPLLRRSLALMIGRGGLIRVADLAVELGCSERYLNRLLRQKVGLSTKTVCEILQLQQAAALLLREQPRSLLHTAVACGYFDQAHMNRRCRHLLLRSASDVRALAAEPAGAALLALLELK